MQRLAVLCRDLQPAASLSPVPAWCLKAFWISVYFLTGVVILLSSSPGVQRSHSGWTSNSHSTTAASLNHPAQCLQPNASTSADTDAAVSLCAL